MRQTATLLIAVGVLLTVTVSVPAEGPTLNGYLRHQLVATLDDTEIVRNAVTAEVDLEYRGNDVGLLINPYFELSPDMNPTIDLREGYLDLYTTILDLRVGKQIIIWGKSDGLAITDIISPKDLTNFLIPDFRELRLGIISAKADMYLGPTTFEAIYIPQFTPSILPRPDSIWYTSLETPIEPTIHTPPNVGTELLDGEIYGRFSIYTSLLDLDLVGGHYWTNEPAPTIEKEFSFPGVLSEITITPEYYRQTLAGGVSQLIDWAFHLARRDGLFYAKAFPNHRSHR